MLASVSASSLSTGAIFQMTTRPESSPVHQFKFNFMPFLLKCLSNNIFRQTLTTRGEFGAIGMNVNGEYGFT